MIANRYPCAGDFGASYTAANGLTIYTGRLADGTKLPALFQATPDTPHTSSLSRPEAAAFLRAMRRAERIAAEFLEV